MVDCCQYGERPSMAHSTLRRDTLCPSSPRSLLNLLRQLSHLVIVAVPLAVIWPCALCFTSFVSMCRRCSILARW